MSKSRGNVVDPEEQLTKFGVDPIRCFLLAEGSLHRDGGTLDYYHAQHKIPNTKSPPHPLIVTLRL